MEPYHVFSISKSCDELIIGDDNKKSKAAKVLARIFLLILNLMPKHTILRFISIVKDGFITENRTMKIYQGATVLQNIFLSYGGSKSGYLFNILLV